MTDEEMDDAVRKAKEAVMPQAKAIFAQMGLPIKSSTATKAYWILGDDIHDLETQVVKDMALDGVTLDDFAPALYDRKEDAERVLSEMQKRCPNLEAEIL
jgi:hypothetical protein